MPRPRQSPQQLGPRILENFAFLKSINTTKSPKKRSQLLANATTDQLLALVEVSANILHGRFGLKPRQVNRLKPFAPLVRKLARSRSEKSAKQIVQTGSGAGLLTAILSPILIDAAQHLIKKISDGE